MRFNRTDFVAPTGQKKAEIKSKRVLLPSTASLLSENTPGMKRRTREKGKITAKGKGKKENKKTREKKRKKK